MSRLIDLRKINIKTTEDALEFLELFVTKAPQIASVLKDQKFKQISLKNRLDHALTTQAQPQTSQVIDESASVLDRMQGRHRGPVPTAEQGRIAQLKAAAQSSTEAPATPPPAAPDTEEDELPPAPVAPGQIGQLNVPTVAGKAPEPTTAPEVDLGEPTGDAADPNGLSATSEATPIEDTTTADQIANVPEVTSGVANASEEAAIEAGGSKSEHPSDDDLQPEDAAGADEGQELSDEEKAALEVPSTTPSIEDTTPIGTRVARKTAKKKGKKKK